MRLIKRFLKVLFILLIAGYLSICGLLYYYQERLLFFPEKTAADVVFEFDNEFIEKNIPTRSGHIINSLLFKKENSKGVIFYLHGNSGNLESVGNVATHFLPLGYDVFMIDYAGFGKSTGGITNQEDLYRDMQDVYDDLKKNYTEGQIVILGYSLGTGIAAHLALQNQPAHLVLHAPYYNMSDMMQRNYPGIPTFILKYKLATNEYLKDYKAPVHLFHGEIDSVIPLESAQRLNSELGIPLYILPNQGHNDMAGNKEALSQLNKILNE
jgi:pimeloyl-ACP methyl ester carboxylesterase